MQQTQDIPKYRKKRRETLSAVTSTAYLTTQSLLRVNTNTKFNFNFTLFLHLHKIKKRIPTERGLTGRTAGRLRRVATTQFSSHVVPRLKRISRCSLKHTRPLFIAICSELHFSQTMAHWKNAKSMLCAKASTTNGSQTAGQTGIVTRALVIVQAEFIYTVIYL